jgi:DNA polymerase-3 subunit epsilon
VFRRWRHKKRCAALAGQCSQPVLRKYLEACSSLDVGDIANTPMISVDLELTGLDVNSNQIISIGWTLIEDGRVQMGSNQHVLINADQSVGISATIHEMMDSEVAKGVELQTGLESLFDAAIGRIWVFHHAGLDVAFLQKACLAWAGIVPPFVVLDTMQIELAVRKRRDLPIGQGDLQLSQLRSDYNLPRYTAHNALIDAFATAELLLAIAARLDREAPLKLSPHLRFI